MAMPPQAPRTAPGPADGTGPHGGGGGPHGAGAPGPSAGGPGPLGGRSTFLFIATFVKSVGALLSTL